MILFKMDMNSKYADRVDFLFKFKDNIQHLPYEIYLSDKTLEELQRHTNITIKEITFAELKSY